ALCHFYMVNLYGDIPLVLTTDVRTNSQTERSAVPVIYEQMIADLLDAKMDLPEDYSHVSGVERVRATKWAAAALLARAYLCQNDYTKSESEAQEIINSGKYHLLSASGIFNKNNAEAIFQFANNSTDNNGVTAFIYTSVPVYVCTPVL